MGEILVLQGLHLIYIWSYGINALSLQKNYKIMRYSIAFKDLPFEPETRQVIYVENKFDERINAIIRDNYDRLKWNFNKANLDFVYLPMFFNDEEIKEKVLYYAPYLTSEIMEKTELRSSYLLKYMSHIENQDKIAPSLLFAPAKDNEEWIFQGQTIELGSDDTINIIHWFEDVIYQIDENLTQAKQSRDIRYDEDIEDFGQPIMSGEGLEEPRVEYSSTHSIWDKLKKQTLNFVKGMVEEEGDARSCGKPSQPTLDEIQEEDVRDTFEELGRNYERLRFKGVPLSVILEYLEKYEKISKILITDDLRIILPDYNNLEVRMTPLHKAVYLLFIYHRKDGIVLQELEKHHHDLISFYQKTLRKKVLSPRQLESINKLETSYNDEESIYSILSKINKAFRNKIDEHLARHYYIEGKPREPYRISLDNDLIVWEDDNE